MIRGIFILSENFKDSFVLLLQELGLLFSQIRPAIVVIGWVDWISDFELHFIFISLFVFNEFMHQRSNDTEIANLSCCDQSLFKKIHWVISDSCFRN